MSPGTRAILSRSNSSNTSNSPTNGFSSSRIPHLSKSKSSAAVSHLSRQGLSRSSSSTFNPPSVKNSWTSANSSSQNKVKKSYSTATLPRNAKLARSETENFVIRPIDHLKKSSSSLRRSSSNDFSLKSPMARSDRSPPRDSRGGISDAIIRSKLTREKHRERPENILQTKKNPPISIQNMNVRANQVIRSSSQSALSKSMGKGVNRSKSTGVISSYTGSRPQRNHRSLSPQTESDSETDHISIRNHSYRKEPSYQSPYAQSRTKYSVRRLSESDSCSETPNPVRKHTYLRKSSGQQQVKKRPTNLKPWDIRGENIRSKKKLKDKGTHDGRNSPHRRGREPYLFQNWSHR